MDSERRSKRAKRKRSIVAAPTPDEDLTPRERRLLALIERRRGAGNEALVIKLKTTLSQILNERLGGAGPGGKTGSYTHRVIPMDEETTALLRKPGLTTKAAPEQRQREATKRYRDSMRQQGMKLVQFWVPDPEAPGYAEECRRQSALIAMAAADPTSLEAQSNRELEAWADELAAGEPEYDWGPGGPPK